MLSNAVDSARASIKPYLMRHRFSQPLNLRLPFPFVLLRVYLADEVEQILQHHLQQLGLGRRNMTLNKDERIHLGCLPSCESCDVILPKQPILHLHLPPIHRRAYCVISSRHYFNR
jgi:hypothetical protein